MLNMRENRQLRYSSVSIVTRLQAGRSGGSNPSEMKGFFSSPQLPARLWGPPNILRKGYRRSVPGLEWLGRDVDHSPPISVGVKNGFNYTSALPPPALYLHGICETE